MCRRASVVAVVAVYFYSGQTTLSLLLLSWLCHQLRIAQTLRVTYFLHFARVVPPPTCLAAAAIFAYSRQHLLSVVLFVSAHLRQAQTDRQSTLMKSSH